MARLFEGNSGLSDYSASNFTYNSVDSTLDPVSGEKFVPFKYDSVGDFEQRVDLSAVGNMIDCGECHVGGGGMQYLPGQRIPLQDIYNSTVAGYDAPMSPNDVTAFNYFIDTYDVDGDGATDVNGKLEAQHIDFDDTGVMEMDCFICHLEGYNYTARRSTLRQARFGALPVVGSGLGGVASEAPAWGSVSGNSSTPGYGNVDYSSNVSLVDNQLQIDSEFFAAMKPQPPADNCAFCHMDHGQVDWKKRGDHWHDDSGNLVPRDYEVHGNLGCMDCHERTGDYETEKEAATKSVGSGKQDFLGFCDPAKGDAPFSSLLNKNDKASFADCQGCHTGDAPNGVAAPDPTSAHVRAGLETAAGVQPGDENDKDWLRAADGTPRSHIDHMDCAACHVRKLDSSTWNTGGALVDATGPDTHGRLADHENENVHRTADDMLALAWKGDKLNKTAVLSTIYWRSKNDNIDANQDGRPDKMDALLMTQVLKAADSYTGPLTTSGLISNQNYNSAVATVDSMLDTWTGGTDQEWKPFLAMLGVPFKVNHGTSPASEAYGAGGCDDCHYDYSTDPTGASHPDANPKPGFYNGPYQLQPDNLTIKATSKGIEPHTKANGGIETTHLHPNVKSKDGTRSIARMYQFDNEKGGLQDMDRSKMLWEDTFTTLADFATVYNSTTAWDGTSDFGGGFLKVDTCVDDNHDGKCDDPADKWYTVKVPGVAGATAGAIYNSIKTANAGFDNNGRFIVDAVDSNTTLLLKADSGFLIRLNKGASGPAFGLGNAQYKPAPYKPTMGALYNSLSADDGNELIDGREEMLAYLNAIGQPPSAGINSVGTKSSEDVDTDGDGTEDAFGVILDSDITLTADTATEGPFEYTWSCTDGGSDEKGASTSRFFNVPGTFSLRLAVKNKNTGAVDTFAAKVNVAAAPVTANGMSGSYDTTVEGEDPTLNLQSVPANTNRLVVIWGDGKRQVVKDVDPNNPPTLQHTFQTFGDYTGSFTTEVRAIDYPDGGLLAVAEVTLAKSTLDGGTVSIADAVAITGVRSGAEQLTTTGGTVDAYDTTSDLVTLEGTRAYNKPIEVTCVDAGNDTDDAPAVGSVWYKSTEVWSVDVQLTEDGNNTCTAVVEGSSPVVDDAVALVYQTGSALTEPTYVDGDFAVPSRANGLMAITLTGGYTAGNTVNVYVDYPSDATVNSVSYDTGSNSFTAAVSGLLTDQTNYLTLKQEDSAGNEGPGNYITIKDDGR